MNRGAYGVICAVRWPRGRRGLGMEEGGVEDEVGDGVNRSVRRTPASTRPVPAQHVRGSPIRQGIVRVMRRYEDAPWRQRAADAAWYRVAGNRRYSVT